MLNPDFAEMLSALSSEGVEFLIVDAYAMAAKRVMRALEKFGAPLFDVKASDLAKPGKGLIMGVPPHRIDILTEIDGVTFADAWSTKASTKVDGFKIQVLGRDALIKNKRAAARPKDLLDVMVLEQHARRTSPAKKIKRKR